MDIIKTKLQIGLGIVICVLIYMHFNKPQGSAPDISMESLQEQSATMSKNPNPLNRAAQSKANQILNSGDIADLESQMGGMGLLE